MLTARRRIPTTAATLSFLLCAMFSAGAYAAETPALKILRHLQSLQGQHGFLAPELLPPLIELGQLYGAGQCDRAIEMLDLALQVSRRKDGLLNEGQLQIYEPLLNCYITLDRPVELDRAQQYVVLIDEQRYGRDDLRMLPTLEQGGRRYEEVGLYLSARKLYRRAIEIASRAAGENALSLVGPLRGIARAFRLEYAYGLGVADFTYLPYESAEIVSYATFDGVNTRLDSFGERSLERAVAILRNHPDADPNVRLETLLELGDWHQLADHRRDALRTYREAWQTLRSDDGRYAIRNVEVLDRPAALVTRHQSGTRVRRASAELDRFEKYIVDLDYAVTRDGRARDVVVIESNAPKRIEIQITRDLKSTKFRPRFVDGEPVDTAGMHQRQKYYSTQLAKPTKLASK
jgi:tetratricopeptide (TPR) repeat protein